MIRAASLAVAVTLSLAGCGCEGRAFSLTRAGSEIASGCAEVASTAAARTAGLTGRAPLKEGQAMWLEFPIVTEACITNGPVSFDIDVAYLSPDGAVLAVERGFRAGDRTLRCHDGVRHVIEWNSANAPSLRVDDRVTW